MISSLSRAALGVNVEAIAQSSMAPVRGGGGGPSEITCPAFLFTLSVLGPSARVQADSETRAQDII